MARVAYDATDLRTPMSERDSLFPARGRLVTEGESLEGLTLISAHGHRRWKARLLDTAPLGHSPKDAVYRLTPQGGDYGTGGGVKALTRSEQQLIARGWRVV